MRVRKKLIVLHTLFTLALAAILLITLGPSLNGLIRAAEIDKATAILNMVSVPGQASQLPTPDGVSVLRGPQAERRLSTERLQEARSHPGKVFEIGQLVDDEGRDKSGAGVATWVPPAEDAPAFESGELVVVEVSIPASRTSSARLFALIIAVLLAVYILVAAALELLVLPGALYAPIERMLRADRALQQGRSDDELISEGEMPSDEFGEIMRSRNASVSALRASEHKLGQAMADLEDAARELKRKNHLLETARRNLEGADRLASLGMMSAGIAHELNTPLAVLKGLTDRVASRPEHTATSEEAALMQRVVARLERLGESLLDFARVREPRHETVVLADVIEEAITLVRLDRTPTGVDIVNSVPGDVAVTGDSDRLVQVFVNLIRNGVDAVVAGGPAREVQPDRQDNRASALVRVSATVGQFCPLPSNAGRPSEATNWVRIEVSDTGPGLDPDQIHRLFDPFFSTRLDAKGTGLGLAVAEGIVHEHGGVLVARNSEKGGAVLEITLPSVGGGPLTAPAEVGQDALRGDAAASPQALPEERGDTR